MDPAQVLALYDTQVRRSEGVGVGPVVRSDGDPAGGWVVHSDLSSGEDADAAIAEQCAWFARLGRPFEWKHHGHDRPADLPARLAAAGFVAEPTETLLVAEVGELLSGALSAAGLPPGVTLCPVTDDEGFAEIRDLRAAVWGADRRSLGRGLAAEYAADPTAIALFRAVAGGRTVCAAWVRFAAGTDFASLWGGSTLPAWRGRGIYRALVRHRAGLAAGRGYRYLQVDAGDASRPILERLGFVPLTTTTPYVWTPPS